MPIFLIHGFKWARVPIREHVVINSVLDASPDYLMSSTSSAAMRASLEMAHPNIMKRIPNIHFVEQYDPEDEATSHAQPYAFVADKVIQSDLNINLREANIQNYIDPVYADAFFELRDVLVGEKVEMGWYMVFNGDPERSGCKTMAQGWENEELEKEMPTNQKKEKPGFFKRLMRRDSSKSKASGAMQGSSPTKESTYS